MMPPNVAASRRGRAPLLGAAGYLCFVVYGSLVPLDFHAVPLATAWKQFLATAYLDLGVGSRADWVANILLYMPLAYLWCDAVSRRTWRAGARGAVAALVVTGCLLVAVAVEFTQLFFPPRTVSLNDLLAETIGSLLGAWTWLALGGTLRRAGERIAAGGTLALRGALGLYVLAYVALSLFPYDFLISSAEFAAKFAEGNRALWLLPQTCSRYALCAGKLIVEAVAIMPAGVLLGPMLSRRRSPWMAAIVIGFAVGATIEALQFAMASGISEGASVASRVVGVVAGYALFRSFDVRWLADLRPRFAAIVVATAPVYVAALAWASRLTQRGWSGWGEAMHRWDEARLLPFYYHYYTTETLAVQSLLVTAVIYAPIGVFGWMLREHARPGIPASGIAPALVAAGVATVVEVAKLFAPNAHPDPTNVIIAAVSAALAYAMAATALRWALNPAGVAPAATQAPTAFAATGDARSPADAVPADTGHARRTWRALAGALVLFAGAGIAVTQYPLGPLPLGAALAVWGIVLWRWPAIGLPASVALLPLLELSDWTGWLILNEFDLFIAVTIAVTLLRGEPRRLLDRPARFVLALFVLSLTASAVIGLLPLTRPDGNALFSYMTGYAALRAAKGPLWAVLMLPLFAAAGPAWPRRLTQGIVAGLAAVIVVVLVQRMMFAGLLDLRTDYRAEGPFPELRIGGADIHAYLILAAPFVVAWALDRVAPVRFALASALLILASYALAVTFARGGYVGYAGALGVLALFAIVRAIGGGHRRRAVFAGVALLVAGAAAVLMVMSGEFMRARVAQSGDEASVRFAHWKRAIGLIDPTPTKWLLGMGSGTFPRTLLFRDPSRASASLSYQRAQGETFARLGAGRPLFLQQAVSLEPASSYRFSIDVRAPDRPARLEVALCEKAYQYSFRCKALLSEDVADSAWMHRTIEFESDGPTARAMGLRRPVVLTLSNSGVAATLEIRNVALVDRNGVPRVVNGDFAHAGSRWNFAADDHLPWHIFNLWIGLLFEQGLVGVLTLMLLVIVATGRALRDALRGDAFAAAVAASTCGLLLVGFSESVFDGPRVATLFFVVLIAGLIPRADTRRLSFHDDLPGPDERLKFTVRRQMAFQRPP